MDIKKFKESWRGAFSDRLEKNEKSQVAKFARYFKKEYYKGIDSYLSTNSEREFSNLFNRRDIEALYMDLYEEVGVDFAKWYARNFEKFIQKQTGNESTWRTTFSRIGQTEAGDKITLVQGTALKELKKNIGNLFKDPDFQTLGRKQQGRILQNRFRGITEYQSQRIVRTEATSAANEGIMQSAQDIFPKSGLVKEWISSLDGRTRSISRGDKSDHLEMNGKVVGFDETFAVPETFRVVQMRKPADFRSGASAHNIVNCRCSMAVYPKEGTEVREGVSLSGIGGGVSARTSQLIGDEIVTSRKPVDDITSRERAQRSTRDRLKDLTPKELLSKQNNGWDLGDTNYLLNFEKGSVDFGFYTAKQAGSSRYLPKTKRVAIVLARRYTKKGNTLKNVLAHEYGHALHNIKGWITKPSKTRSYILDGDFDDDVVKHYKDQLSKIEKIRKKNKNYFNNLTYPKGGDNYKKDLNTFWSNYRKHEARLMKKHNLTKEQFSESWASMQDYFGAITKESLGGGHGLSYYNERGIYGQLAEIFANSHDFYYNKNVVFKELYPEFYKDALEYMEKMLNKL